MTPGLIAGIVMLVALAIAMYFIWTHDWNTQHRRNRVIEDEDVAGPSTTL